MQRAEVRLEGGVEGSGTVQQVPDDFGLVRGEVGSLAGVGVEVIEHGLRPKAVLALEEALLVVEPQAGKPFLRQGGNGHEQLPPALAHGLQLPAEVVREQTRRGSRIGLAFEQRRDVHAVERHALRQRGSGQFGQRGEDIERAAGRGF